MNELYKRIREECEKRGITVSKMCVNIGMSKSMMSDLKSGRKNSFNLETLTKIAAYLEIPVGDLLNAQKTALPEEDGDLAEIRDAIKENPALRALFDASMGLPASRIYEAAALLAKYKEEQN